MFRFTASSDNTIVADAGGYQENTLVKLAMMSDGNKGELRIKTLLADDLSVYLISIKCVDDILLNFDLNKGHRAIAFVLSGTMQLHLPEKGSPKTAPQNTYYNVPTDLKLSVGMSASGDLDICLICLKQSIADKLLSTDAMAYWPGAASAPNGPAMAGIISAVIRHSGEGSFHRIMMIAKTLELLFMSLAQLTDNTSKDDRSTINSTDRGKLEAARALISRDLQSPYSLVELAHKVGLNDFKLKKGFKELYGTTVFGYLTDLRMEQAKRMIASAQYSIGEISHEVGYKNAHHFTVAFKKKFGHVPSKL